MSHVSVIVPIYNVDRFLEKCVDSILGQSLRSIEVLLIDDGSTDRSGEIADAYAEADSRVRVTHQANQGLSAARNSGLAAAQGDWITIVDGDDWLEPTAIETMLTNARAADADIILFDYFRDTPEHSAHDSFFTVGDFDYTQEQARILQANCLVAAGIGNRTATTNMGVTWARLYRRKFLCEHNLQFKVGLSRMQDAIFHLYAFAHADRVAYRASAVYHYRIWPGAASRRYSPEFSKVASEILAEINVFMQSMQPADFDEIYYTKAGKLFLDIVKLQYVGNPIPITEKWRNLRLLLREAPYARARAQAQARYMSPGQAFAWRLVRIGQPLGVYLLYSMRNRLEKIGRPR